LIGVFVLTLVLAIAAIGSALFAAFQASYGRRMAALVMKQFNLSQRPYLYVKSVATRVQDRRLIHCTVTLANCGNSPASEVSVAAFDSNETGGATTLVSQSGMTIFPGQDYDFEWDLSQEVERVLTGYSERSVDLRVSYREALTDTQRLLSGTLVFDVPQMRYVLTSLTEHPAQQA